MSIIAQARPAVALASLDLCQPALAAGWRHAQTMLPGELLCGAAVLHLAAQVIPIRVIVNTGADLAPLLEHVHLDAIRGFYAEQYIVMADFTPEQVRAYQARFKSEPARRVIVGSPQAYLTWLQARLGPLGRLPVTSPVRRLTEHLLCVSSARPPTQKRPLACSYAGSKIQKSFDLGALGVQALETLFAYTRGKAGVVNVEGDPAWQAKDVDLLVRESGLRGAQVRVEVKNEDKATGNIVLEKYSCFERKTTGWLDYSAADVLVSTLWPTGDVVMVDLERVREWVRTTPRKLRLVFGTVPEQNYHSQVYLAPIRALLTDLQDAVHLQLGDWLPELYRDKFAQKSLVLGHQLGKTLHPQRLS